MEQSLQTIWSRADWSKALLLAGIGLLTATEGGSAATPATTSGAELFMHNACFACHGELGYGGAGPGFRNDKLLAADDHVIGQILIGGGIMPSFAHLSDDEIAALATYIRNSWGNQFGGVSPAQVAALRKTLANASTGNPQ
jgi:mono/diheme cytochrome c family protein